MKKHVIFLFFGIFSCVCFAQDFRDTYWDMDMTNLAKEKNVKALSAEEMIKKHICLKNTQG